jgi:long-chain acyl-CoA synthetase
MEHAAGKRDHQAVNDEDIIAASQAVTLWGLFCERVRRSPDAVAYCDYDHTKGIWRDYSWRNISERVDRFRTALALADLSPGDCLAILLPNGINWACLDMAAHALGLVVVGLYPHDNVTSNAYLLGHSDARLVLLDNEARWTALSAQRSEFPLLETVWIGELGRGRPSRTGGPVVRRLSEVLANTTEPPAAYPVKPGDLATLIYTSGTTGRPKGVMLSHFALLWNAEASGVLIPPLRNDVFLSILTLAHAFERTVGHYLPMMGGSTVAYGRSPKDLPDDLIAIRPTAILGVPLLFERMCLSIQAKVADNFIKGKLLHITSAVGWRRFLATQRGRRAGLAVRSAWLLLKQLVAAPVLAAFGGRLRAAVSGGAPLDRDVARMLIGLGVPVVEGYGLTEAAPVVAANRLDDNLPGSVGRPLNGIEVKLSPQDELLVRSPSVMMGYWKDQERTQGALDAAGWLSTGDIAEIQEGGRIVIRGRLKELLVLSIGEKINPTVVESQLTRDPLFEQAMVVGDLRSFVAAVVVLNAKAWELFAAERGLDPRQPNHEASKVELLAKIRPLLAELPHYAQIRAVHLTLQPWTIEAGLLTPTLKIKRERIAPLFVKQIDNLYAKRQI